MRQGEVQLLPPNRRSQRHRILVVDDDEGMRENLAELFVVAGYDVVTAASTPDALEKLRRGGIDLLLTDYRMPGPTGAELIEAARRDRPDVRAVLMTAFGDNFTEIESVRHGAIGYITKPFEANEIVDLVDRILELRGN